MPMKEILYRLQPFQLYIILCLSIAFFLVQLFLSHISHALTLLVQSYHMLCNIICLVGCMLTLKHSSADDDKSRAFRQRTIRRDENEFVEVNFTEEQQHTERSLRNTFGWTRIDVLSMLIVCIFLASLCFSIFVEALQTLVHLDHAGDTMHYPIYVMLCGVLGLVLNAMCYAVIGGYTFHQGSFLSITSAGDVILDAIITDEGVKMGDKRLSTKVPKQVQTHKKRQNVKETCRDVCSSIFVIVCAVLVYFCPVPENEEDFDIPKYIDPIVAMLSCIVLLYFSYPFMKESGLILLQTIPATIDIDVFKTDLLKSFHEIMNVHDLHIWQLTSSKLVSTAHIIFEDHEIYCRIMDDVVNYFHEQGITIVTIQPEFLTDCSLTTKTKITSRTCEYCLMPCKDKMCHPKICCMPETINDSCANSPLHSENLSTTQVLRLSEISSAVISENDTVLSCISLSELSSPSSPIKSCTDDETSQEDSSQTNEPTQKVSIQRLEKSNEQECYECVEVIQPVRSNRRTDIKTEDVPNL